MDFDELLALQKQFEKGAPVPAVDSSDIKRVWVAHKAMEAEYGPRPDTATGLGALGFDQSSLTASDLHGLSTRHQLLITLFGRGVLPQYQNGDDLDERVFRAAATVPFNYEEWAEAMMALKIPEYPPEAVAKVKQDFRDHGYDLDHPKIDAKFLAWMRDGC